MVSSLPGWIAGKLNYNRKKRKKTFRYIFKRHFLQVAASVILYMSTKGSVATVQSSMIQPEWLKHHSQFDQTWSSLMLLSHSVEKCYGDGEVGMWAPALVCSLLQKQQQKKKDYC